MVNSASLIIGIALQMALCTLLAGAAKMLASGLQLTGRPFEKLSAVEVISLLLAKLIFNFLINLELSYHSSALRLSATIFAAVWLARSGNGSKSLTRRLLTLIGILLKLFMRFPLLIRSLFLPMGSQYSLTYLTQTAERWVQNTGRYSLVNPEMCESHRLFFGDDLLHQIWHISPLKTTEPGFTTPIVCIKHHTAMKPGRLVGDSEVCSNLRNSLETED